MSGVFGYCIDYLVWVPVPRGAPNFESPFAATTISTCMWSIVWKFGALRGMTLLSWISGALWSWIKRWDKITNRSLDQASNHEIFSDIWDLPWDILASNPRFLVVSRAVGCIANCFAIVKSIKGLPVAEFFAIVECIKGLPVRIQGLPVRPHVFTLIFLNIRVLQIIQTTHHPHYHVPSLDYLLLHHTSPRTIIQHHASYFIYELR